MENEKLFYIMQFAGGTFPTGGFSQSWGLETYIENKAVYDSSTMISFLEMYLVSTIAKCEGPILCEAYRLSGNWNLRGLVELEEVSTAMKVTKESRESSLRMGKAFLRIATNILKKEEIDILYASMNSSGITNAVAFGAVCGQLNMPVKEAVAAYVFNTVNAIVQSGVKLIPLGNTDAQKVLIDIHDKMSEAADMSLELGIENISNFCPGLDIASIVHETLPVRLYMS